ncbi:hypothetical protein HPB47_022337, partial [Ixodes persulcatus]
LPQSFSDLVRLGWNPDDESCPARLGGDRDERLQNLVNEARQFLAALGQSPADRQDSQASAELRRTLDRLDSLGPLRLLFARGPGRQRNDVDSESSSPPLPSQREMSTQQHEFKLPARGTCTFHWVRCYAFVQWRSGLLKGHVSDRINDNLNDHRPRGNTVSCPNRCFGPSYTWCLHDQRLSGCVSVGPRHYLVQGPDDSASKQLRQNVSQFYDFLPNCYLQQRPCVSDHFINGEYDHLRRRVSRSLKLHPCQRLN